MPRRPELQARLENDKNEQFARCLGMENTLEVCAIGVGYDLEVARALAHQKQIRLRAEEWFSRTKQQAWYKRKMEYPV